ncbi:MAG: hypothetical protein ACI9SC_001564 [Gammaproteobacteria bacterium]
MNVVNKTFVIVSLLMPFTLFNATRAEDGNKIKVITELNEDQRIVEIETEAETPRQNNNVNVNDKTSIQMIVGGQSEDGVAKSINLSVDAK